MRLVLLGPPGSGKGTQGKLLAERFCVLHVATGDVIRDHIARKSDFGVLIESDIANGEFAPSETITRTVLNTLALQDNGGWVLDGFPRDLKQAEAFMKWLDARVPSMPHFIQLSVPAAALIDRLGGRWICGKCDTSYHTDALPENGLICVHDGSPLYRRPEDEPESVLRRLEIYEKITLPVSRFIAKSVPVCNVDGTPDPVSTFDSILHCIGNAHLLGL